MTTFNKYSKLGLVVLSCFASFSLMAQSAQPTAESTLSINLETILVIIAGVFMLIIWQLASVFRQVIDRTIKKDNTKENVTNLSSFLLVGMLSIGFAAQAQDAATSASQATNSIGMQISVVSWLLLALIAIEFIGILVITYLIKKHAISSLPESVESETEKTGLSASFTTLWDKFNSFKPQSEEVLLDTGHNYDGIRELDNKIPPWFTAAFIATIIFSVVYIWYYHFSNIGILQKEEYTNELAVAAQKQLEFNKLKGGSFDESKVAFSDKVSDITIGAELFKNNCESCHGINGNGLVNGANGIGPNLSDEFWIHGGNAVDVYKSIKYGWKEKGMRPWADDFSDEKIAHLASYIHSVSGKNKTGKAPEGEPFKATTETSSDSTVVVADTLKK